MFVPGPSAEGSEARLTRRTFLSGVVVVGAAVGLAGVEGTVRPPSALAATPPSGPPPTTLPLPTTTAPEQLLLTWGHDPATAVTVSWSAPGTVPMPAPMLAWSTAPITAVNPGRTVQLPEPQPLDATQRYPAASTVSFTDGLNAQTTYYYHVQLRDLEPGTRYYYQVSDGAATPSTAGASFQTAPNGRAKFRFSSYGDLATPSYDLNASGNQWHESCDNAYYAVTAIENPGDGNGPPLFHLLNGDLCYANLDFQNASGVWRDFGINISRSAANRPWMPALGNHETEFGTCDHAGRPGNAPGGIGAQAAAGNYWNGPYGYGHYVSRFLLPDNGVRNWDGNHLRGNFYAFQVGTVKWLDPIVDMIVVFMHQCAMSTSVPGNGSDLGIRRAWLPLFDKYEVDLVLSGHEHDYERSYPVRGYDAGALGTVVAPNPDQTKGAAVDTRRPHVVTTEPVTINGTQGWDTQQGTVFLVLGGGGTDGPSNIHGVDAATGLPKGKVITERNAMSGSQAAGFSRNAADSVEEAPWSAAINSGDAYGYGIFDVDPGQRRGETTITFKYFAIPAVSGETTPLHSGTTTLPTTPFETFVFGRGISGQRGHGHDRVEKPVATTAAT
jgi:Purple acid Phosphatase, N-terminal domain/Calcineurin-like phosphoesterase